MTSSFQCLSSAFFFRAATRASGLASILMVAMSLTACSTVREFDAPTSRAVDGQGVKAERDDALAYSVAININAPKEVVWAVLTDGASYTTWNSTVISLDGDIALGKKIALVVKDAPERVFELDVSEVTAPTHMVWEDGMPLGMFAGVRTFTLYPADDGSTNFTMQEVFSGGMLSVIAPELPDFRASFTTFAADLKKESERRAAKNVDAETAPVVDDTSNDGVAPAADAEAASPPN